MNSPAIRPNSYEAAVLEAHALRGEPKAMKGSEFISIFKKVSVVEPALTPDIHFAVRGARSDALKLEGFVEVARMNLAGIITKL